MFEISFSQIVIFHLIFLNKFEISSIIYFICIFPSIFFWLYMSKYLNNWILMFKTTFVFSENFRNCAPLIHCVVWAVWVRLIISEMSKEKLKKVSFTELGFAASAASVIKDNLNNSFVLLWFSTFVSDLRRFSKWN